MGKFEQAATNAFRSALDKTSKSGFVQTLENAQSLCITRAEDRPIHYQASLELYWRNWDRITANHILPTDRPQDRATKIIGLLGTMFLAATAMETIVPAMEADEQDPKGRDN